MTHLVEIRWHGRGGQGAKTASQLLAQAQMQAGLYVQAFPEYGPERSGAPMQAYNRADLSRIRRHDGVEHPNFVVVLDESLWGEIDPAAGLDAGGGLIVNSQRPPEDVAQQTGFRGQIWCVPGDAMARTAGSAYANVVLVGTLARLLQNVPESSLTAAVEEVLGRRMDETRLQATLAATLAGYRWPFGGRAA